MFKEKLIYLVHKTWAAYFLAIASLTVIHVSLKMAGDNLYGVMLGVIVLAVFLFMVSFLNAVNLTRKVNLVRRGIGEREANVMQVELNSSITLLDVSFLIFASWKIGEALAKLPGMISVKPEALPFIFSIIILSFLAVMYSFIKAMDKIKEYKGVSQSDAEKMSSLESLDGCTRLKNSAYEMAIAFFILLVFPGVAGYFFSQ